MDCAKEPGEVETTRNVRERAAPGHQQQLTIPDLFQFGTGHHLRARSRIVDNGLLLARSDQDSEASVLQYGDGSKACLREPVPLRLGKPRFQPELLRAAQHLNHSDFRSSEAMLNLFLFRCDSVHAQQSD
jgi:hypothetical protein